MRFFTGVAVFAATVASLTACSSDGGGGGGGGDDDEGDGFTAEVMCEDFIKDRLKSPSSADFSEQTHTDSNPFTVTGAVDSENSFGAMIRNNYTCVVRYMGNDKWRLKDLDLSEN